MHNGEVSVCYVFAYFLVLTMGLCVTEKGPPLIKDLFFLIFFFRLK